MISRSDDRLIIGTVARIESGTTLVLLSTGHGPSSRLRLKLYTEVRGDQTDHFISTATKRNFSWLIQDNVVEAMILGGVQRTMSERFLVC